MTWLVGISYQPLIDIIFRNNGIYAQPLNFKRGRPVFRILRQANRKIRTSVEIIKWYDTKIAKYYPNVKTIQMVNEKRNVRQIINVKKNHYRPTKRSIFARVFNFPWLLIASLRHVVIDILLDGAVSKLATSINTSLMNFIYEALNREYVSVDSMVYNDDTASSIYCSRPVTINGITTIITFDISNTNIYIYVDELTQ